MEKDDVTAIEVRDAGAYEIALKQNIAANGRLFCFMLFVLCLFLWLYTPGDAFLLLAALCPLPVGLSTVIDPLPVGRLRVALSCIAYGVPAGVSLSTIFTILG